MELSIQAVTQTASKRLKTTLEKIHRLKEENHTLPPPYIYIKRYDEIYTHTFTHRCTHRRTHIYIPTNTHTHRLCLMRHEEAPRQSAGSSSHPG